MTDGKNKNDKFVDSSSHQPPLAPHRRWHHLCSVLMRRSATALERKTVVRFDLSRPGRYEFQRSDPA